MNCEKCGEWVDWSNPNIHYGGHNCKPIDTVIAEYRKGLESPQVIDHYSFTKKQPEFDSHGRCTLCGEIPNWNNPSVHYGGHYCEPARIESYAKHLECKTANKPRCCVCHKIPSIQTTASYNDPYYVCPDCFKK